MEAQKLLDIINSQEINIIKKFQQKIILLVRPYSVQIQSPQYLQLKIKLQHYLHIEIPDNLFDNILQQSENNSYLTAVKTAEFSGLPLEYAMNLSKMQYENYSSFLSKKDAFKLIQELKLPVPQNIIPSVVLQIQPKVGHFKYFFTEVINLTKPCISKNCTPQKLSNQYYDPISYTCQLYNQFPSQKFFINDTSQRKFEIDGTELPRLIINTYHKYPIMQSTNELTRLLQLLQDQKLQQEQAVYKAVYVVAQSYYLKIQEQQNILSRLFSQITQIQKNQIQLEQISEIDMQLENSQLQIQLDKDEENINQIVNLIDFQFKKETFKHQIQKINFQDLFSCFKESLQNSMDYDEKYYIFCQNIYCVLLSLCLSGFFTENFDEVKYSSILQHIQNNQLDKIISSRFNNKYQDNIVFTDNQNLFSQSIPFTHYKQLTVWKLVAITAELFIQSEQQQNNSQEYQQNIKYQQIQNQYYQMGNLREDSEKGKCEICPLVYNNYNQHIKSQLHQDRYKQMLLENDMFDKLVYFQNVTEKENILKTTLESLCLYLSLRILRPYKQVVQIMNKLLFDCKCTIQLDENEDINQNNQWFKNEQYKIWRENVLKQRMNQFESMLYKQQINQLDIIADFLYNSCKYENEFKNKHLFQQSLQELQNKCFTIEELQNQFYSSISLIEQYVSNDSLYANSTQLKCLFPHEENKTEIIVDQNQELIDQFRQIEVQNIYTFDRNNNIVVNSYCSIILKYFKNQKQEEEIKKIPSQNKMELSHEQLLEQYQQMLYLYHTQRKRTLKSEIVLNELLKQKVFKQYRLHPEILSIIKEQTQNLTMLTVFPKVYEKKQPKYKYYQLKCNDSEIDKCITQLQEIYRKIPHQVHDLIKFSQFKSSNRELIEYIQNKYQYKFSTNQQDVNQTQIQQFKEEQTIEYSQSHQMTENIQYDDQAANQYYNQNLHFNGKYVNLKNLNKQLLSAIYNIPTIFSYTPSILQFLISQAEGITRSIMSYQQQKNLSFIQECQILDLNIQNRNQKEKYCQYVDDYEDINLNKNYCQNVPKGNSFFVI